jgi:hypothetical protein
MKGAISRRIKIDFVDIFLKKERERERNGCHVLWSNAIWQRGISGLYYKHIRMIVSVVHK